MSAEITGVVDLDAALGGRPGPLPNGALAAQIKRSALAYERAGFDSVLLAGDALGLDPIVLATYGLPVSDSIRFTVRVPLSRLASPAIATLGEIGGRRVSMLLQPAGAASPTMAGSLRVAIEDSPAGIDPGLLGIAQAVVLHAAPLDDTASRIAALKAANPDLEFGLSIRVILGAAESFAWDRAMGILKRLETLKNAAPARSGPTAPPTPRKEVYDDRFWTGLYDAVTTGEPAALVGTPEQVANALSRYGALGISRFLIQGFHPFSDPQEQGRDLLPLLRRDELSNGAG